MTANTDAATPPGTDTVRSGRAMNIVLWVLQILVAALFVFSGYLKVTSDPASVAGFASMGFAPWVIYVVGALELAGGIGLVVPPLTGLAALGLTALMVGATIAVLVSMGLGMIALPGVTLLIVAFIAWGRRNSTVALTAALRPSQA